MNIIAMRKDQFLLHQAVCILEAVGQYDGTMLEGYRKHLFNVVGCSGCAVDLYIISHYPSLRARVL